MTQGETGERGKSGVRPRNARLPFRRSSDACPCVCVLEECSARAAARSHARLLAPLFSHKERRRALTLCKHEKSKDKTGQSVACLGGLALCVAVIAAAVAAAALAVPPFYYLDVSVPSTTDSIRYSRIFNIPPKSRHILQSASLPKSHSQLPFSITECRTCLLSLYNNLSVAFFSSLVSPFTSCPKKLSSFLPTYQSRSFAGPRNTQHTHAHWKTKKLCRSLI
ncbi:hypothetical protein B0T26DRAFT_63152 [Lasiosphaeria miniovina]|uniref:Transmembrane protein n=1 Tax=Lasiosphaeria miniovina TaxID=1954250 RepID=A0AA40BHH0_9PEZI|nr:uncharacterized protein B0T26DRAFT_63152 [Lasiosphaeria miniovina]KAK0734279.1 hypothetical protein B0T26DRAFT_63152 [Lasiosphaeria miniovina]